MTPHVLSMLPAEDIVLLQKVRRIVEEFPDDVNLGTDPKGATIELSCHILAYACGNVLKLEVQTGCFAPHYDHSWLLTKSGNVLDVYPVGIYPGPLLAERTKTLESPGIRLYMPRMEVWARAVNKPYIQGAIVFATEAVFKVLSYWSK